MIIEDGKFYFIKDEFFDVFKDYGLMVNKENGNKRPCYFCFRDRKNKDIICLKVFKITIEVEEPVDWTIDGEYAGKYPVVKIENLPKNMAFLV